MRNKMFVTDKKTGRVYDPYDEFDKLYRTKWVIEQMKRMKFM